MTTKETLPRPESTYQLLLDAARTWPDGIATQWIPDPADYTRCLDWTYAELAGTVTRIANALTALGVRRQDAVTLSSVNTSMLYAATLAAQAVGIAAPVNPALSGERIAGLIRRTGSRVLVTAGPELDPQLWQRLLEAARQAGMTAVLALRPDGAHGDPPALGLTGDAPAGGTPDTPDGRGPLVAYLDEVIAGLPSGHLAGAGLPEAGDLAAFVHTGGTTGAPKIAAHTHANLLACGQGIAQCSGLAAGEAMLGGLPLFHVNALLVTGIAPMFSGAREGIVRDGWLNTGDLGSVDAGGFVYLTGRAKDLIIRGGHNIDPRTIEEALLAHPAVAAAAAVGRPDRHSGEVPVAYVVPAEAGRFDEADLLAWAATAIGEPAARPKRIYPVTAIPVTAVGKQFKPALAADAAARAVTEALAGAGLADARATTAHENGRLVVTVTGADPSRVRDAVAGFALTIRTGPSPSAQTAAN